MPRRHPLPGHGVVLVLTGTSVEFAGGEAEGWEFPTREAAEAHLARCTAKDRQLLADRFGVGRPVQPKPAVRAA